MKKLLSFLIAFLLMLGIILNQALPADAAKKSAKKKGISQETLTNYQTKIDDLTKKIYEREFYTPEDSKTLIELKLQLDSQMDVMSEASFAPLYFKLGNIFKMRGNEVDAITCYKTILENFSDTAYGPKSRDILEEMGVEIKTPIQEENPEEDGI